MKLRLRNCFWPGWLSLLLFLAATVPVLGDQRVPRERLPLAWKKQAELTDVFFLDHNRGWAVGAQGVILRTVDGGQEWTEISQLTGSSTAEIPLDQKFRNLRRGVNSQWTGVTGVSSARDQPLRCRFESVYFVDSKNGWVAGGYKIPWLDRTRAVILKTTDGGLSWKPVEGLVIPSVRKIQFENLSQGWAIGEIGNLFPVGIYFTSDGGQTWSSASAGQTRSWLTGVQAGSDFVMIDREGQPARVHNHEYEASVVLGPTSASLRDLQMRDDKTGLAVGANGAVVKSENGGLSWTTAVTSADAKMLQGFDFNSLSMTETRAWFAGSPGSTIFSLDQSTGALKAHSTGLALPIHRLAFVDDQTGWAVGALGTVLATTDGGDTWQVQRGTHRSVALLAIEFQAGELPLELLATYAGEENRVCGIARLGAVDPAEIQAAERMGNSVVVSLGRQDAAHRHASDQQFQQLVQIIRMLRPHVIALNGSRPTTTREEMVVQAIAAAADRTQVTDQIDRQRLQPWQVDRLVVRDLTGAMAIDPQRMLPRTGMSVEDRTAISRSLLGQSISGSNSSTSDSQPLRFRVQHFTGSPMSRPTDLFRGLGSTGRPIPSFDGREGFRGNLNAIQIANQKRDKFEQFSGFTVRSEQDLLNWHRHLLSWLLTLDEDLAGVWTWQLGQRYLELGKTELAAKTFEVLATRMSDHGFAPATMTWLAEYYASDEFNQIAFSKVQQWTPDPASSASNPYATRAVSVEVDGTRQLVWQPVNEENGSWDPSPVSPGRTIAQAGHESVIEPDRSELAAAFLTQRRRLAGQWLNRIGQRDPELVAGFEYRFLEATVNRKLNGFLSVESLLKQIVHQSKDESLVIASQRELALANSENEGNSDVGRLRCLKSNTRPHLDGQLTDPVWQSVVRRKAAKAIHRYPQQPGQDPDVVLMAYDDEFLYFAIRCVKLSGQNYQTSSVARPRDANLEHRDRVELVFDVDRDYRGGYQFAIDHRGWVSDRCGNARGWDPAWYVSQSSDDKSWSVEIAIPWEEIAIDDTPRGVTWAIGMRRLTSSNVNRWTEKPEESSRFNRVRPIGFLSQPSQYELMLFE